ncbi:hypothetical protein [Dongia sp.]|uniref:hypothetical protein n=1 Tax=Dongia sp. TaxID=1977262 RepID=UPI003753BD78
MSRLRGKLARCLALLALLAGLIGAAAPGSFAMTPADPASKHAAMDCNQERHGPAPARHLPGIDACCMVNVCAMTLALPAAPSGVNAQAASETRGYDLHTLLQPASITAAPLPHPPKPFA